MFKKAVPYFEMSAAMTFAGSSVVVGKIITGNFPVFLSQGISLVLALSVLIPLSVKLEGKSFRSSGKDLAILFLQALSGMFLFRVFMLYGLKYTSAVHSGILTSTTPAVVAVISFIFLKEKATWAKAAGITASFAGVLAINSAGMFYSSGTSKNQILGSILILLAVVCEALLTVLRKITVGSISPIKGTTFVCLFSFVLFLPFSIKEAAIFDFRQVSLNQWLMLAYFGIIVTAAAYILWFKGVSAVPASTAAVYTACMPVSAVLLSYLILNEPFSWTHVLGILLAVSGMLLTSVCSTKKSSLKYGM